MDYSTLAHLRKHDTTWRLLTSPHAPLIISFLFAVFIKPNERSLPFDQASTQLDDYLFHLNDQYGADTFPKSARQYLDDWANGASPYLRKYYVQGRDIPQLDLTPGAEKAVEWLQGLQPRQFVGTESRLMTLYRLLQEIVQEAEQDPALKIAELEKQKAELERQIARIRSGLVEAADPTRIKERWFEAEDTARKLLADFRQVEYNFRTLDQDVRELIATSEKRKGELLDEIFEQQDYIRDSEQGRSFHAFWEFLMSPQRQQALESMTTAALQQEALREVDDRHFLPRIGFFLLEAGEKVFRTNAQLAEQLRKYLADQAWLEDKRILQLIRGIERTAVAMRNAPPDSRQFAAIDQPRLALDLVMERSLFQPKTKTVLADVKLEEADVSVDVQALYNQHWVDEARLRSNIRRLLHEHPQVSLQEVLQYAPLQQGLAELVAYLNLASKDAKALVDEAVEDVLPLGEAGRTVRLPRILFTR
jgi:flagellar motility protein MotE (MotC chaperone)